jgi:DNA-binding beta-propeller fold protein YncE
MSLLRVLVLTLLPPLIYADDVRAQPARELNAAQDYLLYVLSEGADRIALVRFGPHGVRVEREIPTGDMPTDIDGPHGISISPDKQFYYVSLAHGRPFGSVWKYSTTDDRVVGRVRLGHFPATMDLNADGSLLYVVNFNLHGDMVPSSVSVVATERMLEVARIATCATTHGSMKHDAGGHGIEPPKAGDVSCSPTWAQPSVSGASIFVACNKSDEIVEVDAVSWKVSRRMSARPGVYNLTTTRDGERLIATNKRDQSVSILDVKSGRELARIPTRRKVLHGVVVSPDDRYAFVTVEGIGSEPGTVEVIDLAVGKVVGSVDVSPLAAGIDFFKMETNR